jgi:hypothetical protein
MAVQFESFNSKSVLVGLTGCGKSDSGTSIDANLVGSWTFASTTCGDQSRNDTFTFNDDGTAEDVMTDGACTIAGHETYSTSGNTLIVDYHSSMASDCTGFTPDNTEQLLKLNYAISQSELSITQANGCSSKYGRQVLPAHIGLK